MLDIEHSCNMIRITSYEFQTMIPTVVLKPKTIRSKTNVKNNNLWNWFDREGHPPKEPKKVPRNQNISQAPALRHQLPLIKPGKYYIS